MKQKAKVLALLASAVGLVVAVVVASPLISIQSETEWQDAITATNVKPIQAWNNHMGGGPGDYRIPLLDVVDIGSAMTVGAACCTAGPSLVMSWGTAGDLDNDIVAGWEYEYGVDPDFSNVIIDIDVFPPCFINAISIALRDINGNRRSWTWTVPPLACGIGTHITVNPWLAANGAVPPQQVYQADPGFDIQQVIAIEFCENGTWVASAPANPSGQTTNVWNYWQNLVVSGTVPVETRTWGHVKELYRSEQ